MKFWELVSLFRGEEELLKGVLANHPSEQFGKWLSNFAIHVRNQDRAVLDMVVPSELCRAALARCGRTYLLDGNYLRRHSISSRPLDQQLSALEVYDRFGGSVLEEVEESGSCEIPPTASPRP